MKILRNIIIALGTLFIIAVIGAAIAVKSIDYNKYRGLASEQVKLFTGRDLTINGDLSIELSLTPSLVVDDVRFANAAWGTEKEMATIKRFEAQIRLIPLLSKEIQIVRVILEGPDILLETDSKGQANWVFAPQAKPPASETSEDDGAGAGIMPLVEEVRIVDGRFRYHDAKAGKTLEVLLNKLSARTKGLADPLKIQLDAAYDGKVVQLAGELGSLRQLQSNSAFPLSLTIKAGGADMKISGNIASPLKGEGLDLAVALKGNDIAELAFLADVKLHTMGPYDLAFNLKDKDSVFDLKDLKIKVGSSDLSGDLTLSMIDKRSNIKAALHSQSISTKDFLPPPAGAKDPSSMAVAESSSGQPKRAFSTEPLPLEGLRSLDAALTFTGDRLTHSGITFDNMQLDINLIQGRLKVDPFKARMNEGDIDGGLWVDAAKKTPEFSVDLDGDGISLGTLLKDMKITDLIQGGELKPRIHLKGRGNSVSAIMAGLNGTAKILANNAKIDNKMIDLAGADLVTELINGINPLAEKEDFTLLNCAVLNLNFKDGISKSKNNIGIETAKMNISGGGTITLQEEQLDLAVEPEPKEGIG